jgi:hypothetical protein
MSLFLLHVWYKLITAMLSCHMRRGSNHLPVPPIEPMHCTQVLQAILARNETSRVSFQVAYLRRVLRNDYGGTLHSLFLTQ